MYIAQEIVDEILVRLPVKSLIRFKGVCKSWYFNIKGDSFIAKHTKNETTNEKMLIYQCQCGDTESVFSMYSEQEKDEDDDSPIFFLQSNDQKYLRKPLNPSEQVMYIRYMIGTCSDIVCLDCDGKIIREANHDIAERFITLWNPATRDFKILPPDGVTYTGNVDFGFDIANNDYKVIRIIMEEKEFITHIKIYSLNTKSWREFDCSGLSTRITSPDIGATFGEEKFCWLARESNKYEMLILSFDMGKEVFQKTPLPTGYQHPAVGFTRLVHLHDSIAVVQYSEENFTRKSFTIWTTKHLEQERSSWIQISKIGFPSEILWPLEFWKCKNSNNFLFLLYPNEFVEGPPPESIRYRNAMKGIYMNNQGQIKNVRLMTIKFKNTIVYPFQVVTYIETLVSCNRDHNKSSVRFA